MEPKSGKDMATTRVEHGMMASSTSLKEKDEMGSTTPVPVEETETEKKRPDAEIMKTEGAEPEAVEEGAESTEYLTGYKLFMALLSITLLFFLIMMDMSIISTAVPQITSDFHSLEDIGWYSGAYQLCSAALQPLTGKLYAQVSAKWVILFFFFVFELGSLICGVAVSSTMFIIGRAVAGLGASGLVNGAMTLVAGAVPMAKRPAYMGIMLGVGQIGLIVAPLIGGAFTEYVTWRWCFYINLPLGGVAGVFLALTHIPDETIKPNVSFAVLRKVVPKLDLVGFVLLAPAAIMFLLALQYGSGGYPWNSARIIGLFCGAGVTAIVFMVWEHRVGDKAMIPFSMVRKRIVWTSCIQYTGLMVTTFVGAQYFPIYFQSVKGAGPTLSGVYLLPNILTSIILVILGGTMISKLGYYLPWAVFAGAITAIASGLISTWDPWTSTATWIGYEILYGARGCGIQLGITAIQNAVPPAQSAQGAAFLVFCSNLASACFVVVANTIFTQKLMSEISRLAPSVDPTAALAAGGSAKAVRALLPARSPELDGLLVAYSNAFDTLCYLLIAAACVSFVAAFGMGWVDVRKKKTPEKGDV
ncbi:putative MFS multidrug transporter [Whalleya microplaca]|nr:putative MFS multidrug transporter [Whalleya microplaca]